MDRFRKNAYRRGQIGCPATKKYDSSLQTIQEKEDQLSAKQYIIAGLCTLAAILIAALAFRHFGHTLHTPEPEVEEDHPDHHRAQRTTDRIHPKYIGADGTDTRRNEQIGSRIANHSTQQAKAIQARIDALKQFGNHIQELSLLENSLLETYEAQSFNVSSFCEKVMEQVKRMSVRTLKSLLISQRSKSRQMPNSCNASCYTC